MSSYPAAHAKLLVLLAVCLSALVLPLTFTGGAAATPAIGRYFAAEAPSLVWITNAFMLAFGSLLMAAGTLADRYGRKRIFRLGMLLFGATSSALMLAPSMALFNGLRAVQGGAAALALASGTAALAQEFNGRARTRAFSLLGTIFGIGLAFGPVVAGLLIELAGWRAIFALTTILSALSLMFGVPRMRETRDPLAAGMDFAGALTFSGALTLFTVGLILGPQSGWLSGRVVVLFAVTAALLAAFVHIELRQERPMLDLRLFRIPRFVGVQILPIGTCYAYIVLVVLLPLRLIGIEGISEQQAGWMMMALSAPMLVVPTIAATLTRWVSPGTLSGVGFLIAAAGLQWLRAAAASGEPEMILVPLVVVGVGAGLPWGLMDGLAISVVPTERSGMAAGIFNTMRVAGEGLTLATATALLSALIAVRLQTILPALPADVLAGLSQGLAAGDLPHAVAATSAIWREPMQAVYREAFAILLHVLTTVTALVALAAFLMLGRPGKRESVAPSVHAAH